MGPSLLDRRLYSFGDVDAYLGLKAGTARRWIDGYRRRDRDYAPVIRERRTGDESVSWGEFVETRLLAGFRQRGATLQSLRPAVQRLREELQNPYPLATAKPYLELLGKELVLNVQEASGVDPSVRLVVVRSGQLVLTPSVARFVDEVTFEDGLAQLLATDRVTPDVRFDPRRAQGRPAIRSVPTEVLAEGFRAGEAVGELAELYELSEDQVLQAIRFEMRSQQERTSAA